MAQLARDQDLQRQDRELREEQEAGERASRSTTSSESNLEARRAALVRKGFKNVSTCIFQPLFSSPVDIGPVGRILRSDEITIEKALDWFLPSEVHQLFLEGCNSILQKKQKTLKENCPKGSTRSS